MKVIWINCVTNHLKDRDMPVWQTLRWNLFGQKSILKVQWVGIKQGWWYSQGALYIMAITITRYSLLPTMSLQLAKIIYYISFAITLYKIEYIIYIHLYMFCIQRDRISSCKQRTVWCGSFLCPKSVQFLNLYFILPILFKKL